MKYPQRKPAPTITRNFRNLTPPDPDVVKTGRADNPRKRMNHVIITPFDIFLSERPNAHTITPATAIKYTVKPEKNAVPRELTKNTSNRPAAFIEYCITPT